MQQETTSNFNYVHHHFQEFINSASLSYDFQEFREAELLAATNEKIIFGTDGKDFEISLGNEVPENSGHFKDSFIYLYKFRNAAIYLTKPLILKGDYYMANNEFVHTGPIYHVRFYADKDLLQIRKDGTRFVLETSTANGKDITLEPSSTRFDISSSLSSSPSSSEARSDNSSKAKKGFFTTIKNIFTNSTPSASSNLLSKASRSSTLPNDRSEILIQNMATSIAQQVISEQPGGNPFFESTKAPSTEKKPAAVQSPNANSQSLPRSIL